MGKNTKSNQKRTWKNQLLRSIPRLQVRSVLLFHQRPMNTVSFSPYAGNQKILHFPLLFAVVPRQPYFLSLSSQCMLPVPFVPKTSKNDQESPPLSVDVKMLLKDAMHAFLLVPDLSIESPCYLCL